MFLIVNYFETPWCIAARSRHVNGGGWSSVRELQANNLWKYRTQVRCSWIRNPCRARKIDRGVAVDRRMDDGVTWHPFFTLTLEE